jgi:hypothetical protein
MYADSDEDYVRVIDTKTGITVIRLQAGDVSVSGHIVNGPHLAVPIQLRNLKCIDISGGATLFIMKFC